MIYSPSRQPLSCYVSFSVAPLPRIVAIKHQLWTVLGLLTRPFPSEAVVFPCSSQNLLSLAFGDSLPLLLHPSSSRFPVLLPELFQCTGPRKARLQSLEFLCLIHQK